MQRYFITYWKWLVRLALLCTLALLCALALLCVSGVIVKMPHCSIAKSCCANLKDIGNALELYKSITGHFPDFRGERYVTELVRCCRTGLGPQQLLCPETDVPAAALAAFLGEYSRWSNEVEATSQGNNGCDPSKVQWEPAWISDYVPNPLLAGKGNDAYAAIVNSRSTPWVWERKPFHREGSARNVLFLDGHVETIEEAAFQAMLAQAMLAKGTR